MEQKSRYNTLDSSEFSPDETEVYEILQNIKFFKENNIVGEDLKILIDNLKFERMDEDEFVFHFGEFGDKFYIILEGAVKILRPIKNKEFEEHEEKRGSIFNQTEVKKPMKRNSKSKPNGNFIVNPYENLEYQELVTLGKGSSFGELALNENKPRAATIRCAEPTIFAVLNKFGYDKVIGKILKKKLNIKIKFLKSIPYFSRWTNMALSKFGYDHKIMKFKRNQNVFKEGDSGDYVYIVQDGEFELTKSKFPCFAII